MYKKNKMNIKINDYSNNLRKITLRNSNEQLMTTTYTI